MTVCLFFCGLVVGGVEWSSRGFWDELASTGPKLQYSAAADVFLVSLHSLDN